MNGLVELSLLWVMGCRAARLYRREKTSQPISLLFKPITVFYLLLASFVLGGMNFNFSLYWIWWLKELNESNERKRKLKWVEQPPCELIYGWLWAHSAHLPHSIHFKTKELSFRSLHLPLALFFPRSSFINDWEELRQFKQVKDIMNKNKLRAKRIVNNKEWVELINGFDVFFSELIKWMVSLEWN